MRLLRLVAPFRWWIVLAALLGFATVGSSIGLMATSAYIIAKAALHPPLADLQVAIVGVRFFGLARGVFRYLERYVSHQVTFRLLARLRVWFYRAIEPLAPARLVDRHSGDLLSRILADIGSLEQFYVRVIAPPAVAGLTLALTVWLMGRFSGRLAASAGLMLLLAGLGLPWLTRRLGRGVGQALTETRARLSAALVDTVQGAADLLLSGQEAGQRQKTDRLGRELAHWQARETALSGFHTALAEMLVDWTALVILLVAIPQVNRGALDGVYLALLVLAAMSAFEAVLPLPEAWQNLEASLTAARRLFELVDAPPAVADPPEPLPPPARFDLSVRGLTFRYRPGEPPALQEVSFRLAEGAKIALVGPSGAGKSTLLHLLLRFWEVEQGQIRLGGSDLRRYRAEDVRRVMALVSQQTHLFNGTIRDNLRLARPTATEAELAAAVQKAQLDAFIQSLPDGYDTWIGEQGVRLSGGERQRVAVARALLQNAPILLLDEPTANLDPDTEQALLETIFDALADRSILMATHRLVGMDRMDEILVLRQGRIVERGRHVDLLEADGLYRFLWERRF
ncbi:MAG: thiol reductant ABC exporter subunit CydC [Chloroflexi bacterium]|nr:MAG: thiol reductant ABC exporter subunit CydC [Chloroflexota bacterium]